METSREKLAELLELQRVDSAIDRLRHRRQHLPEQAQLDSLTEALAVVERAQGSQQVIVDGAASSQKKLDGEIESIAAKIASEEAKLYSGKVANPKELSSIQAEIESLKRRRAAVEDLDLEVMEEREVAEAELTKLKSQAELLRRSVSDMTQQRDAALSETSEQLAAQERERSAWVGKFDPELLEFYDDLRSSKGGIAAAALVDGACQGCHMKLPAQEVSRIRKTEGLVRCVECGRILVVLP